MKKYFIIVLVVLILFFIVFKRVVKFVWVNPYTQTSGYSYISPVIRGIDNALNFALETAEQQNKGFKYKFKNAYGSGFLNNNPIPNDLDYSVGIDLGEYEYDGKNAEEIAKSVVDKMDAFQYSFNFYINSLESKDFYIDKSQFELLGIISKQHDKNVKAISQSLPKALSGKEYIKHTVKVMENTELNMPYIMKANEILIENYDPIMLYSDKVSYNNSMQTYMRGISIIPEFFVKVNGIEIEIVPESFVGERMQLERRFFASSAFVGNESERFLKNVSFINNDDEYLYYRMLSYKRHLQEISNIEVMKDRPVKMFKRIMQTADIISPLLDEEIKADISSVVLKNLQNRDIQLLNEYSNVCVNIYLIQDYPKLYLKLLADGKIKEMYNVLLSVVNELQLRGNLTQENMEHLKRFADIDLSKLLLIEDANEVYIFKKQIFDRQYKQISDIVNSSVFLLLEDKEKLDKYVKLFDKIYTDAGYHKVSLYWLDDNTIGILKDDFTKNIKDLKTFAKENDLTDVNYKLIENPSKLTVKYSVRARYNPSAKEQKNYEKMINALLEDKKNFKVKTKFVF